VIKKADELVAAVAVTLLVLAAILWVLFQPERWTSCLVLVMAAIPIAILGKEDRR